MNDDHEDGEIPDPKSAPDEKAENTSLAEIAVGVGTRPSTLISLGKYNDADILTKKELCAVFRCGARTLQRMVDRYEVPPPIWLGGRKVWIVGNLRAWLDEIAKRHEKEAAKVARKMRIFLD